MFVPIEMEDGVDYLTVSDMAKRGGVSRARVTKLYQEGKQKEAEK